MKDNLFLIGPMGAGKSTIGKALAEELRCEFYDSDHIIQERTGVDLSWLVSIEGEEGLAQREEAVIAELCQLKGIVLSTGGGSIMQAANRQSLKDNGRILYLYSSETVQISRTQQNRLNRPQLDVDDLPNTIDHLTKERTPIYEDLADVRFCTDKKTVRAMVKEIIETLQIES